MARLTRVAPIGFPQHVIQRGNNKETCFKTETDMKAYLNWLKKYSKKYSVDIHAWVLMTNHIHLLCTPQEKNGLSKMMQAIGRMYVRHFNHVHQRTGTLWEGRFKTSIIESNRYLLTLYRYIELNPIRAKIVANPADYRYSSYKINALGMSSNILTAHQEYLNLGKSKIDRILNYQSLFSDALSDDLVNVIRRKVNKNLALGDSNFAKHIERITNKRVTARKAGRPPKKNDLSLL